MTLFLSPLSLFGMVLPFSTLAMKDKVQKRGCGVLPLESGLGEPCGRRHGVGAEGDGVAALGDLISGASQMGEEWLQQPRRYLLTAAPRDREDH